MKPFQMAASGAGKALIAIARQRLDLGFQFQHQQQGRHQAAADCPVRCTSSSNVAGS
jgi:hypothetical protein